MNNYGRITPGTILARSGGKVKAASRGGARHFLVQAWSDQFTITGLGDTGTVESHSQTDSEANSALGAVQSRCGQQLSKAKTVVSLERTRRTLSFRSFTKPSIVSNSV